jgi:hypothetical protein
METERLYSPLEFYLHDPCEEERSGEYGKFDLYDVRYRMHPIEAYEFMDAIELAVRRDRDRMDQKRGMAEYLSGTLGDKVESMFPAVEFHGNELYCVTEVTLRAPLTPQEMSELKDWWSGQLSDGWGEGFEQREIKIGGEELYIRPWTSDDGFFVETEREFHGRLGLEPMVIPVLEDVPAETSAWDTLHEQGAETERKGYIAAVSDGDGYIPGAVHIERDDSLNIYPNDHAAARAAEADGVRLIYGLPHIPDGMYLDTPENRAIAGRISEQSRLAMPAGDNLKQRLFEQLDDGFMMYRDNVLTFDKERLFNDAAKIAASREAYAYFRRKHPYTVGQAEFLLKFHNPMEVIQARWHSRSGEAKIAPETIFADPQEAFGDFTLAEDTPNETWEPTKPRSFGEWKNRWREESKNRLSTAKKEPGHNKHDPDL